MGNISLHELAALVCRYLDREKLIRENPSVTKEMIDAFFQEISGIEKVEKTHDASVSARHAALPCPVVQKGSEKEVCEFIIHTDGASRGNPGRAGIGVAIFDNNYHRIDELSSFIGISTNNVAEYRAMILAAEEAIARNAKKVIFKTDSELLVRQLNGTYRVKSPNILPLYKELMILLKKIPVWKIQHVGREKNAVADTLANKGIDLI